MKTSTHRILTTHAGSLVRPPEIVEAMILASLGEPLEESAYLDSLRAAVGTVVERQAKVGIDVIDDGEFGKSNWITYLSERIDGLERVPPERSPAGRYSKGWPDQDRFGEFYRTYDAYETIQWLPDTPSKLRYRGNQGTEYLTVLCTGPLSYREGPVRRDIENLTRALEQGRCEEAFMPVVAPASIEIVPDRHYGDEIEYLFALADVLNVEYRAIVDAGLLLQVDDAILPMQRFMKFRDKSLSEYRAWAEVRVEALNRALSGIPEDRVRYHICFGSQNIPHTTDPDLRDLIDLVLEVRAQAYSIEACNPRHEHEWQIWKDVKLPEGKVLIPGMLSHATNIVEHPELVAMRIENFARLVGRERVIAGSDCGFSQSWNSPRVHPEIQWAKLEALVAGARIASARLWP